MRTRRLSEDDRGIEGLPVRLVIALVVGVASLGVMLNMVSGLSGLGVTELDVAPQPEVTGPGPTNVTVAAVGPDGERVRNATVVARSGSARLDGPRVGHTGPNGTVTMRLDPKLGANQAEGTVRFSVKPPAGEGFVDRRGNTVLLVVRG
ncbi:Ig domain-containing protein group 1 domain-containing protein [Halobacteriales archaeon QS_4_70_19]|nr:MAG: Ig domain-containing protein group 1 domain-containing protein [Halobacteriales archaeon QS_4_70_19]